MARRRSGYVQIDALELLSEIDDEELLDEVEERGLSLSGPTYDGDFVREAHTELICGRVAEALSILERLLHPKWRSQDACAKSYDMFRKGSRQ